MTTVLLEPDATPPNAARKVIPVTSENTIQRRCRSTANLRATAKHAPTRQAKPMPATTNQFAKQISIRMADAAVTVYLAGYGRPPKTATP